MSALAGALSPALLSLVVPVPAAVGVDGLSAAPVWLSLAGLLGVGFRDVLGGGRDDEPVVGDDLEADFFGDEFDDDGDEDHDDLDDGLGMEESPLDEVEPRIEDLESEVEDVAAGISAVRGEHESMRESVEEIEEHVRKLLEVYEVVNRGMNPFADDPPAMAAGAAASDLFGASAQEAPEPEPAPDDDLFADVEDGGADAEEPAPADDGLSFEDLKTEFEYVGDEPPADLDLPLDEADVEDLVEDEMALEDDPVGGDRAGGDGSPRDGAAKPYLTAVPGGYGAELLVMEWLDFLVSESSMGDALRAVRYYETVDWITSDVASHLQAVLSATSPEVAAAATDGGRLAELTVDHHTQSLEFIAELGRLAEGEGGLPGAGGDRSGLGHGRGERGVQR